MRKQEAHKRKLTGTMKKKLAGLFCLILLVLICLILMITYINAKSGDKYTKQVLTQSQQQYESTSIPFKRGDILDRNGNILATSVKVYNVILDCKAVNSKDSYKEPTKEALAKYLDIEEDTVESLLTEEATKESQYQILKKQISMEDKKNFEAMTEINDEDELSDEEVKWRNNVQGVWFEEDYKRTYPMNSLACDVIGFTYSGNVADWGLEGYYNSTLNGTDGRRFGYFTEDSSLEQNIIDPVNGNTLVSTLDVNIQNVVDKYIAAFDEKLSEGIDGGEKAENGAKNIGVIVANPNNGEILAMGSDTPYDLNNPRDLTGAYTENEIKAMNDSQTEEALFEMWRNYCVTDIYEPGSVVKPIIVASALESGAVTESDTFVCDGGEQVTTDYFIKCAVYPDSHGTETLGEIILNSCNDGMMAIGQRMGTSTMVDYQSRFNFGTRTGIDLPSEGTGLVFSKERMGVSELATTSFGQGFSCTMIQEIAALSACINGGTYYQPHVVKEIRDDKGNTVKTIGANVMKEVISSEVSADIRQYMGMSVKSGTSMTAKVPGYSMGGKTGTAEKFPRDQGNYLVSFIGFAPLNNPQVVIYVVVDEPNVENQATSTYAQYIAQAILSEILPYMNIYPDETAEEEIQLWKGFTGVKRIDETSDNEDGEGENDENIDGISNPGMPGPPEDDSEGEIELNDEQSDGITNEDAGFEDE